jgi:Winged helix DNA-binding domain
VGSDAPRRLDGADTPAMRRIETAERRARIAVRHRLAPAHRAAEAVETARGVVCLHATDPASVYLSAWARLLSGAFAPLSEALYEKRSLLRILAMRRTLFVVPTDEAPVLQAAASLGVARTERQRNAQLAERLGLPDPAAFLREAEQATLETLERLGEATAAELAREVPALARKVRVNVGKSYEGDIGINSRVLIVLALDGLIVRAQPRGTWISSQYRWTTMERWLGAPLPVLEEADAQARLVERWLEQFGPGTEADLRWWTGLTARAVRAALARVGAQEVELEGEPKVGYVVPGDDGRTPTPGPWVALLPSLDPTTMGWRDRAWYLGEYQPVLFDTAGNAGPTIWVDGRIVGGWAVRAGGEVVTALLEDIGRDAELAVEAEAARLSVLLASVRVFPRFPTPLHGKLVS